MPDEQRTQQIEKRIDREVVGGLSIVSGGGTMTIAPRNMGELMEFAKLMAVAGDCIRPAFRGNAGACLSLCLQAFRWGADPFAVANKAYITTGKSGTQIAYESQLIHAIVNCSPMLVRRLRSQYEGAGTQRKCIVIGVVRGEDEPFVYESPTIAQIAVKNSPLWQGDPDQQLFYYATRAWARRYLPEVLLGIYTPDEVQGEIIDMTPQHGAVQEAVAAVEQPIPWEVYDAEGNRYEFERSNSAIEACRKILITSAAADPAKLATAWENNAGFIISLGQEGLEPEAQGIEQLYAELMPQEQPETGQPLSPAASEASGGADDGEGAHAPPPADAKRDQPPPTPPQDERSDTEPTNDTPQPQRVPAPPAQHSPAGAQPRKEVTSASLAASTPRQPAPAGDTDLLGGRPAENLMVPLARADQKDAAKLDYYARQILSMAGEAPKDAARRTRIRLANETGLIALKAGLPERYDQVMAELYRK